MFYITHPVRLRHNHKELNRNKKKKEKQYFIQKKKKRVLVGDFQN